MTLILNEMWLLNGLKQTFWIAAADRRISNPDGSPHSTRRKLFEIPYLNGAVSYFGRATVYPRGRETHLSDWLANFIRHQSTAPSFQGFAERLRDELNQIVPTTILKARASGFHICGYDSKGLPDFWYLSNIGWHRDFKYIGLKPEYAAPKSHFLGRDARQEKGTSVPKLHNYFDIDLRFSYSLLKTAAF